MPAFFTYGFSVRELPWHELGSVPMEYPGRDEAILLAGHDFDVTAAPLFARVGNPEAPAFIEVPGWRQLIATSNSDRKSPVHGNLLHIAKDSYAVIQNTVAYDFAEALLDQGFLYETGVTLKDGALCALTLRLDEPIQITGDNSVTLPYIGLSWSHDGSGALRGRSTNVRIVCANTESASEAQGKRLGTDFSIRHTQNWKDRVEDAKKAVTGARRDIAEYREVMEAMAAIPVTVADRELFASAVVLDQKVASVSRFKADVAKGAYSARVQTNVEKAKTDVLGLFGGPTIPDEHKLTAYGLQLAGVEYLDHIRKAHNDATKVGRSLLRDEPAKGRLTPLIHDIVNAR
jgi:phage/plasmid-like protein (TIGR03299 family)